LITQHKQTHNIKKHKQIKSKNTTADKKQQKTQHNPKNNTSGNMEHKHPTGEESREEQPFKKICGIGLWSPRLLQHLMVLPSFSTN